MRQRNKGRGRKIVKLEEVLQKELIGILEEEAKKRSFFTEPLKVIQSFNTFLEELKKWNRVYNLTSLKEEREIVVKHFIDSLLALRWIKDEDKLLDLGSGAGFPGLPIKICLPELYLVSIDSRRKKIAFQKHVLRKLGLKKVEVLWERAENITSLFINKWQTFFDGIISRATFSLGELMEIVGTHARASLLKEGGILISMKGKLDDKVKKELENLSELFYLWEITLFQLPFGMGERNIIVIQCKIQN